MPKQRATPNQLKTVIDNRGSHRTSRQATHCSADASTITVRVSLSTQRRGTRKLIIVPAGQTMWAPQKARIDNTLIKAVARAYRWNRLLEGGECTSLTELAEAEGVTESYLARILRLTLLAPKLVEAILEGKSPGLPQLQQLVRPFSTSWARQERMWLTAEL